MRLIDADVLKDSFKDKEGNEFTAFHFYEAIEKAPTLPNPCGKPCAFERPHGEWIPCSERLPKEIGDYLVTEKLSDIARAVYTSSFGHIRTGELCFYYEDDECRAIKNDGIVAWMPLPEPYKKEGEQNDV